LGKTLDDGAGSCIPQRRPTGLKPERVAAMIREMIIQDELSPGSPIRERALSERLQVSRTPLREALKILSAEGLVDLQPRRGATVASPGDEEVRAMLQLLGALESFAGALACETATEEDMAELWALHYEMLASYSRGDKLGYFHRNQSIHFGIVNAARNAPLIEHHRIVNARVYRVRYVSNLRTERWESAIREHEEILRAIEARDAARVRPLLERHVLQAWDQMQSLARQRE
jgi:DNA-binding GntR family transcriptional regulator